MSLDMLIIMGKRVVSPPLFVSLNWIILVLIRGGRLFVRRLVYHLIAFMVAVIFAVVFYFDSLELPDSANQLPQLISYIIAILATGMLISAFLDYRKNVKNEEEEPGKINAMRAVIFVGIVTLYIFILNMVGYFITTPIFMLSTFYYLKSSNNRNICLLYTSPSPRDGLLSRMPSSA